MVYGETVVCAKPEKEEEVSHLDKQSSLRNHRLSVN